jgi:hypothetical protein
MSNIPTLGSIKPKNSWAAQFYFYGDIDPVENRAYFAGPYHGQEGRFYVTSFPVNKKTGRAWQAGKLVVDDCTSKQEAIDIIKKITGNY